MDIYLVHPAGLAYTVERNDWLREKKVKSASEKGVVFDICCLESFYYARNDKTVDRIFPYIGSFLLDSGAFTFMVNSKVSVDWDAYTEEYAEYINARRIDRFFELDIDSIVGLKEVERLRAKLESLTGKQPIPVWHLSRGKDYFVKMCERYGYVSIGGIVSEEIKRDRYEQLFPWFISTAHERGCKIHALGYTGKLKRYRFDSVDSTAWQFGNRGGYIYLFNEKTGEMGKQDVPEGKKCRTQRVATHNFNEWVKYGDWTKRNL